jgi:multidrug resistance efflux pump
MRSIRCRLRHWWDHMIHIEHYHDHACEHAACQSILAALSDLKESIMSIQETVATLKTEVSETKAQGVAVLAALTGLLGVVQPLTEALADSKVMLQAAKDELAASTANTTAIEADLSNQITELDATQAAVQPAVDAALAALPPAPPAP